MDTKQKILSKSLELFNTQGIKETTLRNIARALGMSQGNLNYHFKTKDEIISHLYSDLVDKMNTEMQKLLHEQPLMSFLYESSGTSMHCLFQYRFIIKDLNKVLQADIKLKKHYLALQRYRQGQFLQIFRNMIEQGLLRDEEFEEEYTRLYHRMNILGDNWINTAELFFSDNTGSVEYYHQLLFEVIYPYLTEKGKKEYHRIAR